MVKKYGARYIDFKVKTLEGYMKKELKVLILGAIVTVLAQGCNHAASFQDANSDKLEILAEFEVSNQDATNTEASKLYMWWLDPKLDNCFAEDTQILTTLGYKNVQDVSIGDYVIGADKTTEFYVYSTTLDEFNGNIINISINNHTLSVTDIHPIVTYKNNSLIVVQAKDLNTGDFVFADNEWQYATISTEPYTGFVYNVILWENNDNIKSSLDTYARTLFANGIVTADLTIQRLLLDN